MFFIAAIFMIIGVVLLRGVLTLPAISQEKAFQETSYLDKSLDNIQKEYGIISAAAASQPNASISGAAYLYNFTRFYHTDLDARTLYVFIVSNATDQSFTATIGNFMNENVTGTLGVTGAAPASVYFSLNDAANATYSFTGSSSWITVTLNYTAGPQAAVEKFYFNDSARNYIAGFFDVQLRSDSMMVRSKNYYNKTW